jgi:hypothetical protein
MKRSQISYLWKSPRVAQQFAAGVSLHSHTNRSKETLDFLVKLVRDDGWVGHLLRSFNASFAARHQVPFDYTRAYWTPPLPPRLAFDLERRQIETRLGRPALVSITDHDDMQAPLLLRTVASARHIPVSVEWTVPFAGDQVFHLGIHNLPSSTGAAWMRTFHEFTANPCPGSQRDRQTERQTDRRPERLTELLSALHALPNVLVVFNHPMWDLYSIGAALHAHSVEAFMQQNGEFIHAIELNGLRNWDENRAVMQLAGRWNKLLISGGDRHGVEPNANTNLTHATTFNDFVHEVRVEGKSHVLFMPQYMQPWKHRIMQSTVDAIRDHPDLPAGSRAWDERVFYPFSDGDRPLSELWPGNAAPMALRMAVAAVRLMGRAPVSSGLRLAWNTGREAQFALSETEAY